MNILNKLSIKSLKLNKKRTIGTIIGIILSTSLICAVAGMFTSFQKTLVENAINEEGYYHLKARNISEEDYKDLTVNRKIKDIKTMYDLGYALYNKDSNEPLIHIYSTLDFDDLSFKITNGRKPIDDSEIVVSRKVLLDSNLKVGDTITWNVGTRVTDDGYTLDESNPYHEELENIVDTHLETYKIVGSFSKPGYNYGAFAITAKEKSDSIYAFCVLRNPKNYKKDIPSILGQKNFDETEIRDLDNVKFDYEINNELLRWEVFAFSDSTVGMLTTVVSTVIVIIIISSVFCIRNSFAISVTEKTKMYGMLSSVGATKKQIKRSVINEGMILGLIGIPLGIISGIFADYVLIKIVNIIFDGMLLSNLEEFVFHVSLMSILVSIVLGFVTIYFSSISMARRASKISPIENITNSQDVSLNNKRLKVPKIVDKMFHVGGVLAYKNLKRSKKKYRTTVISITISVFVFISMNSFLSKTFDLSNKYYSDYDYNLSFQNVNNLSEDEINSIRSFVGVDMVHAYYEVNKHDYVKIYDKSMIEEHPYDVELDQDCVYDKVQDKTECFGDTYKSLQVISLDNESYKMYVKELGLNYNEIKDKGILVDRFDYYDGPVRKSVRGYKYNVGDTIKGVYHDSDFSIEIVSIPEIRPYGIEDRQYSGGYLLVNKDYYDSTFGFVPVFVMVNSNEVDDTIKMIEAMDADVSVTNYEEDKKHDKAIKLVVSIFLYGFIIVITLIGVTSIFNTITSNMELRSKEFGVLKSVGMTKREFSHMINLETIFYSFKSLLFGIILGICGSYVIHKGFSKKLDAIFQLPYLPIILSIVFVFLLVYVIMRFSISRINKQNTIETIRNDNI